MRICIEIEANFKAILSENIYTPTIDRYGNAVLNMKSHLSSYEISLPSWNGPQRVVRPFLAWKDGENLSWYGAYNASKHDRHNEFKRANMQNLIDAFAGLVVVLSSQFQTENFSAAPDPITTGSGYYTDMIPSISSLAIIRFPEDWDDEEK